MKLHTVRDSVLPLRGTVAPGQSRPVRSQLSDLTSCSQLLRTANRLSQQLPFHTYMHTRHVHPSSFGLPHVNHLSKDPAREQCNTR